MSVLLASLWLALLPAQGVTPPTPAPQPPRRPLYDSTRVDLRYSPGISHKTTTQAVITYGKIGAGKPLDRADSLFLRYWSPAIIGAPDNPTPPRAAHPTPPAW